MMMLTLLFCMIHGCTAGPAAMKSQRTYGAFDRGEAQASPEEDPWDGVVFLLQQVSAMPAPRSPVCYTGTEQVYHLEVLTPQGAWRPVSRPQRSPEEALRAAPKLAELQDVEVNDLVSCAQVQPWAEELREEGYDPRYVWGEGVSFASIQPDASAE